MCRYAPIMPDHVEARSIPIALSDLRTSQLFELYRGTLAELRMRGVVRTENAPAGDYAEYLVARALDGVLAPNSEKSWDVRLTGGKRIQVKCRVFSDPPTAGQQQLSPFRSFDFDSVVIVLLSNTDYSVRRAVELPRSVVETFSVFRQHVNGYIVRVTSDLLDHPEAIDLTARLLDAYSA